MKLDSMSFFRLASERMQWLSARQRVISENIANADTPGYRAQDVASFDAFVEHVRSNEAQLGPTDFTTLTPVETVTADDSWTGTLSGNTVVLEQQTVKAGETAQQYRLAANLYRKAHELLNLAAK
ncbi:flagellar basal body rod protein FlgB [Acidimangrovimonas pyrenivorans]|uniref:Flagellar basal body rod protein FlgB n=1 Tax=Acidimangrovimonas pyrenivorans TaxID=2030798 RepID=A0ABV7AM38_9RHOB